MEQLRKPYYLGIDFNDQYAVISFFQENMKEPDTVSTVAGGEVHRIPMLVAKRKGIGQWYYGDEAKKMAKTCEMICVDQLLRRSVAGESIMIEGESFQAEDLLLLFLQKLILLPQKLGNPGRFDRLVITVERLTKENMELFWRLAKQLELEEGRFMVIDHKESFYYFSLSQADELWLHDVFLFHCQQEQIYYYGLQRNFNTTPQVITITESDKGQLAENRDQSFLALLQEAFANRIVSTVYLVGDGFEGDWMRESVNYMCRNRRAFMGKNLFSKGACYAAMVRQKEEDWNFIYMGENEMKFNLSLKVKKAGEPTFYNLISAGRNWFETSGQCEVILNGEKEINFWKQLPHSREAVIETLELTDLPQRPERTTRLSISAVPISNEKIHITIKDMGFGEFFHSTDKTWNYTMSI